MTSSEPPWKGTVMVGLLLVVLGWLFFAPFFMGDMILFPQHTGSLLPWKDELSKDQIKELRRASNPLMTDKVFMFHPDLMINKKALGEGRIPLWDPYPMGGVPHHAQGLPGLFSLANCAYLFMDIARSHAVSGFVQVVLAGLFMMLFLRALEIRHFPAFLGGLAFGCSGWMLFHLHYFMMTSAALWLPLLLLGTEKLMRRARPWWLFALALGAFQTLCAGFPQIGIINLYLTTAYALVRALTLMRSGFSRAMRRLALTGLGIFLGILLSGVQLLPSADVGFSESTTRKEPTLEEVRELRLQPISLLTYLSPDLFGHPDLTKKTGSPHIRKASLMSLALQRQDSGVNYLEIQGYVGVLPFILALLVFFARPQRGWLFFAVTAALSIGISLGLPGLLEITSRLPGLMIGDAKRFLFPAAMALSVLAAFTLDACWRTDGPPLRLPAIGLGLISVLLVVVAVAWIGLINRSDAELKETVSKAIEENTGIARAEVEQNIDSSDLGLHREHLSGALLRTALNLALTALALLLTTGWTREWTASRPIIVAILI
ncbi:MAG: YfhO family protein, partial [Planctomycetes bacterium]|nr:YfhO family protein [Planctomycetota bacterium]